MKKFFEETDLYIRLLPRRNRGLLRILFSRLGMALLLLMAQLFLIVAFYNWADTHLRWFGGTIGVFTIIMLFRLFNCNMDATAKLTWLVLMSIAPVPVSLMLLFKDIDPSRHLVGQWVHQNIQATKTLLPQDEAVRTAPEVVSAGVDDLCRFLNQSGCFPLYSNTQVTYFPLGEQKFAAMLRELRKAERFIFLEYFIIEEGVMWGSILKILAQKAREGVDVRVLYDGMCEVSTLSPDYPERMQALGIQCKPFSPLRPFVSTHYNYRDHRKIAVIDGKVAFNGGVNLADEYINQVNRFGHWKDTAVMLRGEAVQSFTLMFLQMWYVKDSVRGWDKFLMPDLIDRALGTEHTGEAEGYVMPYCDCPFDNYKVGQCVYMDMLNRAKTYVHIMTPYLILDNELETALRFAAERGVDVRLILPGIPDKKAAYSLAKSHYRYLMQSGVRIYEYTPGFVHAKVFVSDDERAVVGTINLDYRSLYHHFECATYLFRTPCIAQIEADYQQTLEMSHEVTAEDVRHEKLYYRMTGSVMKFIAPLM